MSLDSKEIKTIEQWRWSEMQGIELLSPNNQERGSTTAGERRERESMDVPPETTSKMKDEEDEPKEATQAVAFKELFRFADGLDCVLMLIGSLGAFVHGCSLPLFLRFFADLVNSFGSYANNPDKMMQEVLKVLFGNILSLLNIEILFLLTSGFLIFLGKILVGSTRFISLRLEQQFGSLHGLVSFPFLHHLSFLVGSNFLNLLGF